MNNRGFTLVEVLASFVIITIVITSIMAVFMQSNKIAAHNNEKLVVVNLADAYLERLKVEPSIIDFNSSTPSEVFYSPQNCTALCEFLNISINDKQYSITIHAKQSSHEIDLNLIKVLVKVESTSSNVSSKVEGYLPYEE